MFKFIKHSLYLLLIISTLFIVYTLSVELIFLKNYGTSTATTDSKKIGTISIYSSPLDYPSLSRLTGHSWIYIQNTSDTDYKIFNYDLKSNEAISFGTTAHPSMSSPGIWVNLEGSNPTYLENISLTADFYLEDLAYLETYLQHHNKWTLLFNCTTFACGVWNNLSSGELYPLYSIYPKSLYKRIEKLYDSNNQPIYELNKEFPLNSNYSPLKSD